MNSVEAPHQQLFHLQDEGRLDILVSAWLPSSHGTYLSLTGTGSVLAPQYRPYCIWAVPSYVPEEQVGEVAT